MPTFHMARAAVTIITKRSPLSLLISQAPSASCAPVKSLTAQIGETQGELRAVHLKYHLTTAEGC